MEVGSHTDKLIVFAVVETSAVAVEGVADDLAAIDSEETVDVPVSAHNQCIGGGDGVACKVDTLGGKIYLLHLYSGIVNPFERRLADRQDVIGFIA